MRESAEPYDWGPIRKAMRNRVNATSLRDLARDLAMSASGLQNFLDGVTPRSKGPVFLEWFLKYGASWADRNAVLAAAIEVVVAHAADDRGDEVRSYLQDALLTTPG
jgi:hypothetical protein